jgi:hypothetical protein
MQQAVSDERGKTFLSALLIGLTDDIIPNVIEISKDSELQREAPCAACLHRYLREQGLITDEIGID